MAEKWKVCWEKPFYSIENINTICWGWHSPRNKYWFPSFLLYRWQTMAFWTLNLFVVLMLTDSVSIELIVSFFSCFLLATPPLPAPALKEAWHSFYFAAFCGRQDSKGVVKINVTLPVLRFSVRSDSSDFSITIRNTVTISWEHKVLVMIKHSHLKKPYFPANLAIRRMFVVYWQTVDIIFHSVQLLQTPILLSVQANP